MPERGPRDSSRDPMLDTPDPVGDTLAHEGGCWHETGIGIIPSPSPPQSAALPNIRRPQGLVWPEGVFLSLGEVEAG